jgi:hypothetical protein
MSDWKVTREQLQEMNYQLQKADELVVWLVTTRTAQESKLFPVLPYMTMSYLDAYHRYPDLIREAYQYITPEQAGDRIREQTCKLSKLTLWCAYNFYLYGRLLLLNSGLIRPQDNLEDLWLMTDWYKRVSLSYHRQNPHITIREADGIAEELPERTLQVLEADAIAVSPESELQTAIKRFVPVLSQYTFLAHCECRIGLSNSGPYSLGGDGRLTMVTKDWLDLAENDFPWLDGVTEEIPYNNLTMSVVLKDVKSEVVDWASLYTTPEYFMDNVIGVGLYTSDFLSEGYIPVGMDNEKALTDTLNDLSDRVDRATRRLYRRIASMNWDQMVDAGNYVYAHSAADFMHMAGTYRQSDWEYVDERTERFRMLFNEEFSRSDYMEYWVGLTGRQQVRNEYHIHSITKGSGTNSPLIPYSVLNDHDYTRRVNPKGLGAVQGKTSLPPKTAKYTTTRGKLTQDEMNARARDFKPRTLQEPWVNYDDTWVQHHWDTEEAGQLYRWTQEKSRLLKARGAGLLRKDIDAIRKAAGEPTWSEFL